MNERIDYERLMADALTGALTEADAAKLQAHLASDAEAADAFRQMKETLDLVSMPARLEPPAAFWDGFYDRLEARLQAEVLPAQPAPTVATWWRRGVASLAEALAPVPRPALQLAMAIGLIAVGVLIGRSMIGTSTPATPSMAGNGAGEAPALVQQASMETRAHSYLDRSKVLLLGLVNMDADAVDPAALNMPRKQAVARALVAEASVLQDSLEGPEQQRLRELVADLEVILLQIANLEAQYDAPAIEMVQHGVDHKALLLKINLEEMRIDTKKASDDEPSI